MLQLRNWKTKRNHKENILIYVNEIQSVWFIIYNIWMIYIYTYIYIVWIMMKQILRGTLHTLNA